MQYVANCIKNYIANANDKLDKNILLSCLKIYESHHLLLDMMCYFTKSITRNTAIDELVNNYRQFVQKAEIAYKLSEKYKISQNIDILNRIVDIYTYLYTEEKTLLWELASITQTTYTYIGKFENNISIG